MVIEEITTKTRLRIALYNRIFRFCLLLIELVISVEYIDEWQISGEGTAQA